MRLRGLLLMLLAIAGMTSTTGCVVAESVFLTTHMRHEAISGAYAPEEPATATPARRAPVDVPAEASAQ